MTRTFVIAAALALAVTLPAAPAQAQVARTFVSAAGSDSNNCANVATPCRHFAAAFAVTNTNGEIYVLDPANYGSLTITHAVSIQGHGWGSIAPTSSGNAITINAPATDAVNLDGLTIDGTALPSTNGIVFNSGQSLTVANCIVRNTTNSGLSFNSNATTSQTLSVSSSYFSNNSFNGIVVSTLSSGAVTVSLDRVGLHDNAFAGLNVIGEFGTGAINVNVVDSVAANNTGVPGDGVGFFVQSAMGKSVINLSLTRSSATGNSFGISASGINATMLIGQSTVTGNSVGYFAGSSGTILSYGDNYIGGNGSNSGSLGSTTKQ
jgi:hypothetical protein